MNTTPGANLSTDQKQQEPTTLASLEAVIESSLAQRQRMPLALLEIHDRQLYRPQYSSFQDYLHRRWQISRSRGYQLLHLARMSTTVDGERPANERQARALNADGSAQQRPEKDSIDRAMNYLQRVFDKLQFHERPDFLYFLRMRLDELEETLQGPMKVQPAADLRNEPKWPVKTVDDRSHEPGINL